MTPATIAAPPTTRQARPIAVVQGTSGRHIQRLFDDFIGRWRSACRLVGAIEVPETSPDAAIDRSRIRAITDGRSYPLFQDLGSGSTACALAPEGAVLAAATVCRDIARGCDLVLLSKFGKLEAESRSGLLSAFTAAIEADVPVLTSVAPRYTAQWARFADPFFEILPPGLDAIETWWSSLPRKPGMSGRYPVQWAK
jgi:hypothetical protein